MGELANLIDTLLLNVTLYPVTIWKIIFSPSEVFIDVNSPRLCPSGMTFLFTVAIAYFIFLVSISQNPTIQKWIDTKDINLKSLVIFCAVYIGIIINLQLWAISKVGHIDEVPLNDQLHSLLYAANPVFLFAAIVTPLMRFGDWAFVFYLPIHAVYFWCLFNICRVQFGFETSDAIFGAGYAYLFFLGFALVVGTTLTFLSYLRKKDS